MLLKELIHTKDLLSKSVIKTVHLSVLELEGLNLFLLIAKLLQEVVVMGLDGVRLNSLKGRLILDLFVL